MPAPTGPGGGAPVKLSQKRLYFDMPRLGRHPHPDGAPLVTVVVPVYNRQRYLAEAIASALAQTFEKHEIVVADDASTVDVRSIVERFRDPRLIYVRNRENLGVAANICAAISRANGKYVAILNDDDAWEREFLAAMVPPLEADPGLAAAFCDHWITRSDGSIDVAESETNTVRFGRHLLTPGVQRPFAHLVLLRNSVPSAMGAVFRKSAVDWADFPRDVGSFYDLWLGYLASRTGLGARYDPRRLTRYRVHAESESAALGTPSGHIRRLRQSEYLARRFASDPALGALRWPLRYRHLRATAALALELAGNGDQEGARLAVAMARTARPSAALATLALAMRFPGPLASRLARTLRRARS